MTAKAASETQQEKRIHPVVTKTYAPRVVVYTLVPFMMLAVMPPEARPITAIAFIVNLLYPHIAYYISRRSTDSRVMGFRFLYFDGFLVGIDMGLVAYRLLPASVFLLLSVATLIVMGGWKLFFRAIWMLPLGSLLGALVSGFDPYAPISTLATILCYAIVTGFVIVMAYSVNVTTREVIATKHELRDKNRQVLKQTEMLGSMSDFTHKVNSSPHLDEVVDAVLQGLQNIFEFDLMGIGIVDHERGALVVDREVGAAAIAPEKFEDLTVPLAEANSVFAACIAKREPMYVPEILKSSVEQMSPSDRAIYEAAPSVSTLVLPLIVQDQVIGTISFGNSKQPFDLSKGAIQTIEQYVSRLAAAIRNARLYEEAQLARAEAQKANETKSQFLANMSHELRTPMNAVIGYSEMLEEEAEDEGLTDFIPDLRKIQVAGRHLLELINGILDLSKIEANKMELFLETGDVVRMVDGVVSTVKPLVANNNNKFEVERDDSLGKMHVDRTKLRQALLNLLSNASKFTENGNIRLAVNRHVEDSGDWLTFAVSDSGIGMTEEQMTRLFQPFTQADASTTRKFGGTGLGLTISRHFCQMMGGDILVQSKPGEGSTFTIRIPAVVHENAAEEPGRQAQTADTDSQGAPTGQPVVLVIDDDAAIRDIMQKMLRKEGFDVITAAGGEEGLRLARERRPVAITLDVLMPDMDGWMVLSKLKSDEDLADIPVVMQTIVDDQKMGFALGATEYLTKPIDRSRMTRILRKFRGPDAGGKVMIIEDDRDVTRLLREQLAAEGLQVAEAANGREALELLRKERPAMILLDLLMPEMDGFELLDIIHSQQEWKDIPVVIITGKELTAEETSALNSRVSDVVHKSHLSESDVVEKIKEQLSQLTA